MDVLYDVQADTEIIVRSSNVQRSHKKSIKEKIQFIDSQITKYNIGAVSRFEYIKALANKFKPMK